MAGPHRFLSYFNDQNTNTRRLSYEDLADFEHERVKIERKLDESLKTKLNVDYSDFANHTFFDSALSKLDIAKKRILTEYPFDGDVKEKDNFIISGTGYENYIFDQWPRFVGYAEFNGTNQYITASDSANKLLLGSSSLYVSTWIKPSITNQNIILQVLSGSSGSTFFNKQGYELYLSGTTDPHIKFTIYSGSQKVSVSAAYTDFTSSFNNVAVIYNNQADLLSIYVNNLRKSSGTVSFSQIDFKPVTLFIGSGSQLSAPSSSFSFYSGSLNEVRILHTASQLYHVKNYSRPINSKNFDMI